MVVVILLLGLLVWKTTHNSAGKIARTVDSGKIIPAYPFSRPLVGASGKISLAGLRGKVVVLNFWQSYCPPCTHEAPVVSAAAKRWAGKNVVFVGVDEQDLSGPGDQVHAAVRHHLPGDLRRRPADRALRRHRATPRRSSSTATAA